ncbi:DNA helicase/exodeoxyribonuclease V, gamma subunit [Nocardioides alpinus]|uniref:RecBCD enzyme subunit RecC n=1 Tax=Nocardioides alpinus TaxID=748909 RepID=A0A1I1B423_9ACTN|nr:exodeoxyribonuclease V subunit gamma [Nocardioides alpinus]PKH40186.1 exodeoxyribonuclease V subunit gamma [Nocardioides alpinus]SFB44827.1 DNA helicase/exodeoxyribonuclease V, gamma subunit [Nocardioides alpinus]
MTLHLHTAERTDALADGLADLLVTPLPDPFAREVVVVPARGVERWLTQRLSHRLGVGPRGGDGVCAGVDFVSPHSLVSLLLDRDAEDPWSPDRLAWPLLAVIDDVMGAPGFEDLTTHLGGGDPDDDRSARRYAVARRLAGLLSSCAVQRPQVLTDWREGRDSDGAGGVLDGDLRWQAELWRRLLAVVDVTPPDVRHAETVARLRSGGGDLDLPPRLSLFGHTRLPETEVALLTALGELREVHLWLPQASTALWDALAPAAREGQVPRAVDDSAAVVGHPLLSSLGRDARELRRTLGDLPSTPATIPPPTADTLLGLLQHDLRANHAPSVEERSARAWGGDDSVQVHACHGAARQVDVLREVLVGLLQDDPTLEPRDILVMVPDIETYAPLISAAFGMADVAGEGAGHPGHQLRVRLADRSLAATNPLLALAAQLVELVRGRMTASQVLDVAGADPVRARFGLGDEELERIAHWVDVSGVRWGYDAQHRDTFGLGGLDANTWVTGLRRVLLGAAMSGLDHRQVSGTVPVDDVSDGDLDLVGRFAEFVERVHTFVASAERATSVSDWTTAVGGAVHALTSTPLDEIWQVAQFDREVARIAAGAADTGTTLRQADVRALLQQRLRGRPTRSNFRTGTLTVCTMVPMRSVPHRVVCLVGLDDGVFPRVSTVDGDDVLARRPRTGERDLRAEDRQLFLDAIVAATDKLVITYTGRGEHTGAERPPAVPLGELLDALDRTTSAPVRDRVLTHHPLQPFDEANFVAGRLRGGGAFTFDRFALAGASAARSDREAVGVLVPAPLPVADATPQDLSLADLQDFFAHPVRGFFRRLRIARPYAADEVKDAIPITLDALEKWAVGDRLAAEVLGGADAIAVGEALRVTGQLPPGPLGKGVLDEIVTVVRPLVIRALELRRGPQRSLDVDIDLGGGRRLSGTVGDVWGNNAVSVSFSNLGAKHRLAAWINALALAAGLPDENWTVHTIGKHRSGGQVQLIGPMAQHQAEQWLRDLVALYDAGQCEPLPVPVKTSLAWAEEFRRVRDGSDGDPDVKGRAAWETPRFNDSGFPLEDADAWHVRAFGEHADYALLASPTRAGEAGPHRLGHFAWRLWSPLIDGGHEQIRGL